jgi:hypothetical protein
MIILSRLSAIGLMFQSIKILSEITYFLSQKCSQTSLSLTISKRKENQAFVYSSIVCQRFPANLSVGIVQRKVATAKTMQETGKRWAEYPNASKLRIKFRSVMMLVSCIRIVKISVRSKPKYLRHSHRKSRLFSFSFQFT